MIPPHNHTHLRFFENKNPTASPQVHHHDQHIPLVKAETAPFTAVRPLDKKKLPALKGYIDKNINTGRISRSKSPERAPIKLVSMKYGSLRRSIDYAARNAITITHPMTLPLISEERMSQCLYD
jgi:hypothetical protein